MYPLSELKRNLKKESNGFKKIKVAILGDTSTQLLAIALKGYAYHCQLQLELFEADFNQIERQAFDYSSGLYKFDPEVIVIFYSVEKLKHKYYKASEQNKIDFAESHLQSVRDVQHAITAGLNCKIIMYNLCEIDDFIFGNYANKVNTSFIYHVRKINLELMHLAQRSPDLYICDISTLQNQFGRTSSFSTSVYANTDIVFSPEFIPFVAKSTLDIISALQGKIIKCVILDLDGTLWGGVIGDDGMENIQIGNLGSGKIFTEFQHWLKALKERGIILAVCSKNSEAIAMQPFQSHPDMVLKLEDFAVFVANWESKVVNIRYIQSVLNIGFDSFVFLDDNPAERSIVQQHIPDIIVPDLPEDPAEYLRFLYSQNLFETTSLSREDATRSRGYQVETKRTEARKSFVDEKTFLSSLEMFSEVQPFNSYNIPRAAQLTQRSNQFNLRTIRYTESELQRMAANDQFFTLTFTLEDKFGDNGLISVVILKKEERNTLFVDSWLMSCRVLKRGMELFVLNTLIEHAQESGYLTLKGEYIASPKNELVRNHYQSLGFAESNGYWYLPVQDHKIPEYFIRLKQLEYDYEEK